MRTALNRTYESYPGAKPAVIQVKTKLWIRVNVNQPTSQDKPYKGSGLGPETTESPAPTSSFALTQANFMATW